jgi:hypothetical protein
LVWSCPSAEAASFLICCNVGFSLPDRTPEAIVETLLEVCFGELALLFGAAARLFGAAVLPLTLLAVAGLAGPVFGELDCVALLFAAVALAPLLGAAARAPPPRPLEGAAFVLLLFPPPELPLLGLALRAISQLPCFEFVLNSAQQTCRHERLWQALARQSAWRFLDVFAQAFCGERGNAVCGRDREGS